MTAGTAQRIAFYQDRCQRMVAPPNISHKPKKVKGQHKKGCTKPPHNPLRGTLRKRTARLHERQHGMQNLVNTPGYRKPGSMTK